MLSSKKSRKRSSKWWDWRTGFTVKLSRTGGQLGGESLKFWKHHGGDCQLWYYTQYHVCIGRFNGAVTSHVQLLFQNIMVSLKIWWHGKWVSIDFHQLNHFLFKLRELWNLQDCKLCLCVCCFFNFSSFIFIGTDWIKAGSQFNSSYL